MLETGFTFSGLKSRDVESMEIHEIACRVGYLG